MGPARFLHLVRAPEDAERTSRTSRKGKEKAWRTDLRAPVSTWRERILEVLADDQPRTFNAIVLAATDREYTADVAMGSPAETALWALVADYRLAHTVSKPIRFAIPRALP